MADHHALRLASLQLNRSGRLLTPRRLCGDLIPQTRCMPKRSARQHLPTWRLHWMTVKRSHPGLQVQSAAMPLGATFRPLMTSGYWHDRRERRCGSKRDGGD